MTDYQVIVCSLIFGFGVACNNVDDAKTTAAIGGSSHSGNGGNTNVSGEGGGGYSNTSGTSSTRISSSAVGGISATSETNPITVTPPSCETEGAGLTDCGANHESCCTSIVVPGGTFYRTYSNDGSGAANLDDPATLSGFRLDKYPVTVGRYRQFVAAWNQGTGFTPAVGSGKHTHLNGGKGLTDSGALGSFESGWSASFDSDVQPTTSNLACDATYSSWTETTDSHDNLPMNCVNWFEAYAFCIWDGGFLPSEAEYEFAAAGGNEQRKYPWGAQDAATNSKYAICNCNYPDASGSCTGLSNLAPVGTATLGAGRWGHLDLVGNVTEWNLDWFSPTFVNPCTDCANLSDGSGKVIRDGYFSSSDGTLQISYRNSLYPTNRFYSFGFRCARTP